MTKRTRTTRRAAPRGVDSTARDASTAAKPLAGRVAIVAGATRGAGRGIARALGEAGAIVYCTGRSTRGSPSHYARPETIDETAELVTAAGGIAIPVRVDHAAETEVQALFDRVDREQGRLDVLASSLGGEDPMLGPWGPFWETDLSRAADVFRNAILSHLITAKHAARLMIRRRRGLIVEITESDLLTGGGGGSILNGLVKHATKGLALMMADELRKHRVAALAITPGYLRSESMLQHYGVTEENWREGAKKDPNFLHSETPLFVGRAVAALAADPKVLARTGDVTSSWEIAREFGFIDADGSRPDWGRHVQESVIPSLKWFREGLERYAALLERHAGRARRYLGSHNAAEPRGRDAGRQASPSSTLDSAAPL